MAALELQFLALSFFAFSAFGLFLVVHLQISGKVSSEL
jgi:hypothetical protein